MMRTQGPDNNEMKINGIRRHSIMRETGKRSQNERYKSPEANAGLEPVPDESDRVQIMNNFSGQDILA